MIRLVKGAYWDSEIKRAQVEGLEGYPVYTRKPYTDVSYIACARKLLAVPEAIYPQFATHNAHSLSAIYQLAGQNYYPGQYEFQCLHGMGEPLYEQVVGKVADGKLNRPCRVYAPVGTARNPAGLPGTSPAGKRRQHLVRQPHRRPVASRSRSWWPTRWPASSRWPRQEGGFGLPHPRIPLPRDLYGSDRANSAGIDLANEHRLALAVLRPAGNRTQQLESRADARLRLQRSNTAGRCCNPSDLRDVVGQVQEATVEDVDNAIQCAHQRRHRSGRPPRPPSAPRSWNVPPT